MPMLLAGALAIGNFGCSDSDKPQELPPVKVDLDAASHDASHGSKTGDISMPIPDAGPTCLDGKTEEQACGMCGTSSRT